MNKDISKKRGKIDKDEDKDRSIGNKRVFSA